MSTKKQNIIRKSLIILSSFTFGVISTVFAAVGFDVISISDRATGVIAEYKVEAAKSNDQKSYYSLARADLALLYKEVDKQLATLAGEPTQTNTQESEVIQSKIAVVGPGPGSGSTTPQSVCGVDPSPIIAGPAMRKCNPTTKQWYTDSGNGDTSDLAICGPDNTFVVGPATRKCNPTTKQWYTDNGNGDTGTPSGARECTGSVPSGNGVVTSGYTSTTNGARINTTWMYAGDAVNSIGCTWTCKPGYSVNPNKNGCSAKAAGSGLVVHVQDSSGNPVKGISIEVIGTLLSAGTKVVATSTTDAAGNTSEMYPETGYLTYVLKVNDTKYKIYKASGCTVRVGRGAEYCDSPKIENSSITISINSASKGPTGLEQVILTSSCGSQAVSAITTGVNKSDTPRGCAKPQGKTGCENASAGFRTFTSTEHTPGSDTIRTSTPAGIFYPGTFEFYLMYEDDIPLLVGRKTISGC